MRDRVALSRDRILDTALSIIDDAGVDGLTMRRLGTEIGVDPMMVYRHFPNKAAVLDGVMERIWAGVRIDLTSDDAPWQDALAELMHGLRRSLLVHPRAISIVGTRPATGPELFALMDRFIAMLTAAGMQVDSRSADLLNALVNYTVGHVLAEAGDPVGGEADDQSHLAVLAVHFPHLAAVFNSGWQYDPFRQYDGAVRAMIAGWPAGRPAEQETADD